MNNNVSPQSPHIPGLEQSWSYNLELPKDTRAPRIARLTLRAVLTTYKLPQLIDLAELLACELVTNAVLHSDGPSSMRMSSTPDRLRISVWDTNPTIPLMFEHSRVWPGPFAPDSDGGRGLLLVRRCADDWGGFVLGKELCGMTGKLLWVEILRRDVFTIAA